MKNLYGSVLSYMMILAWYIVGLTACQEYEIDSQQWGDGVLKMEIDARDSYTALGTSPADIIFNISSNTPWNIESSEQWCKVTPAMSAASSLTATVTVSLESNMKLEPRTATLTIKGEGIEEAKVITITQEAKNELEVVYDNQIAPATGGEITFGVISNKAWRVSTTAQFLMDMEPKSGEGRNDSNPENVTVTLPANTGARRTGTVTIKTELSEFSFTITQDGNYLEVVENNLVILEAGEEKIIAVNANVEWKAAVDEKYADFITTEKLSASELKITVKKNGSFATRTGEIKIVSEDTALGMETKITISQAGNTGFTLTGVTSDENGNIKLGVGGTVVSKFGTTTGCITFEFDEINLTGSAGIRLNMDGGAEGMYNYFINPSNPKSCGPWVGAALGYVGYNSKYALTHEEANAIRRIEIIIKENESSKIDIQIVVDGKEVALLKDRNNLWTEESKGLKIYVQPQKFTTTDYCVIKSISYEPFE